MKIIAQSLITIFLALSIQAAQAWVSVGSSPGFGICDYTNIQDALDADETEIRILNSQFFNQDFVENLTVDYSVDMIGGYSTCTSTSGAYPVSEQTVIKGSASLGSPVIKIDSTNSPNINLYNLILQDATDTIFVTNGGQGIDVGSSNGLIQLYNTEIRDNAAEDGGGIFVGNTSGDLNLILHNSRLVNNVAQTRGGGLFCAGSGTVIRVSGDSLIADNEAHDGGGIAALNGCILTVDSGTPLTPGSGQRGIINNSANHHGGGVYLNSGAHISLQGNKYGLGILGNNTEPVTVANNTATENGGGIYAKNSASIEITDGLITNNTSFGSGGGGVFLDESSGSTAVSLTMASSNTSCWRAEQCSILSGNISSGFGGGVFVGGGAQAHIENTHIMTNLANFGTAVYVSGAGGGNSMASIEGSYIFTNGSNGQSTPDQYVLRAIGGAQLSVIHSTVVDNDANDSNSIIGVLNSDLVLKNSIIHNTGETVLLIDPGSTSEVSCLVVNENGSVSGTVFDPEFVDSSNQDYHLSANSQAMDFCSDEGISMLDADGDTRGWDDPTINNSPGMTFDPGADESYASDIIFKNGFE